MPRKVTVKVNNINLIFNKLYYEQLTPGNSKQFEEDVKKKNEMIFLQKFKDSAFWGYSAIAGNLHNFGGRINLHGDLSCSASDSRRRQTVSRSVSDRGPFPSASSAVTRQVSLSRPSGPVNRLTVLAPVIRAAARPPGRAISTTSVRGCPSSSARPLALSPSKYPASFSPAKTA